MTEDAEEKSEDSELAHDDDDETWVSIAHYLRCFLHGDVESGEVLQELTSRWIPNEEKEAEKEKLHLLILACLQITKMHDDFSRAESVFLILGNVAARFHHEEETLPALFEYTENVLQYCLCPFVLAATMRLLTSVLLGPGSCLHFIPSVTILSTVESVLHNSLSSLLLAETARFLDASLYFAFHFWAGQNEPVLLAIFLQSFEDKDQGHEVLELLSAGICSGGTTSGFSFLLRSMDTFLTKWKAKEETQTRRLMVLLCSFFANSPFPLSRKETYDLLVVLGGELLPSEETIVYCDDIFSVLQRLLETFVEDLIERKTNTCEATARLVPVFFQSYYNTSLSEQPTHALLAKTVSNIVDLVKEAQVDQWVREKSCELENTCAAISLLVTRTSLGK